MSSPRAKIWWIVGILIALCWAVAVALEANIQGAWDFAARRGVIAWVGLLAVVVVLWIPTLAAAREGRYPKAHLAAATAANALLLLLLAGLMVFNWPPRLLIAIAFATAAAFGARGVVAWTIARHARK